ncbi:glycoside hydrolase family 13 protein [Arthrobacter sp. AD-310]
MKQFETVGNALPHHDGSALYVTNPHPQLGESVTVYIRTDASAPIGRVFVRTTPDGEPHYREAVVDRVTRDQEIWWRATVEVRNPVTRYRFLLQSGRAQQWLTAAGVAGREVPDATDFVLTTHAPPPTWGADSIAYQIFPDRFHNSGQSRHTPPGWARPARWSDPIPHGTPEALTQLFGGDLWGVRDKLDHIAALGADLIYLTPFFPSQSNHRYDATTFDHVDPLLGGDEALRALTEEAHRRNMKVIGDITLNHSGDGHEWFQQGRDNPASPEAGFYYFDRSDGSYATFLGAKSLPKFDHRSGELRRRLYDGPESVIARYIQEFGLDGWRVDVAQSAGRYGGVELNQLVASRTRATMGADKLLIAEHQFDASETLLGDGWHGTMSYAGFTRPAWSWLARERFEEFWGVPGPIPQYGGEDLAEVVRHFSARIPWQSFQHNFTLIDSHDTARFRSVAGADRQHLAAALMMTLPGVPMIFAGDEIGLEGLNMEAARIPFPWDQARWDLGTLSIYKDLVRLRRQYRALRRGGLRWLHAAEETIIFERALPEETLLVQITRGNHEPVQSLFAATSLTGGPELVPGGQFPSDGPAFHIWSVQP